MPSAHKNKKVSEVMEMRPILIVDDDPLILGLLRDTLSLAGYPMRSVCDGEEALASITREGLPSVVIMDIMMPYMNGFQFLAALEVLHISLPVVVITASASPAVEWQLAELKAQGKIARVFLKPFSILHLLEEVSALALASSVRVL